MARDVEISSKFVGTSDYSSVQINAITLTKDINSKPVDLNILGDLTLLTIQESIYSFCLTGTLVIKDRSSIFELSPFIGNEKLTISMKSLFTEYEFKRTFNVVGIKYEKINPAERSGTIILTFKESLSENFYKEYSTSFSKKPISEFVKHMLEKFIGADKKLFNIEQTEGNFTFAFPYQKPTYILQYLNRFAKNKDNGINFQLYSSMFGGYNYKAVSSLIKGKEIYTLTEEVSEKAKYIPNAFSEYTPTQTLDIEKLILERGVSTRVLSWDSTTKQAKTETVKQSEVISELKLGYEFNYFSKKYEDSVLPYYNHYLSNKDSIIHKVALLNNFIQNAPSVSIAIKGLVERSVGDCVKIKFMDKAISKFDEDKNWSGKYFTKSVTHMFTTNDYRQAITYIRPGAFVKDSSTQ